jgi:hypothetical protein
MRESVYVTCSVPKNSAIKIPFQTNGLHSALTASALLAVLNIALRESHCSSSHLRGNNHRDSTANRVNDLRMAMSAFGRPAIACHIAAMHDHASHDHASVT